MHTRTHKQDIGKGEERDTKRGNLREIESQSRFKIFVSSIYLILNINTYLFYILLFNC